ATRLDSELQGCTTIAGVPRSSTVLISPRSRTRASFRLDRSKHGPPLRRPASGSGEAAPRPRDELPPLPFGLRNHTVIPAAMSQMTYRNRSKCAPSDKITHNADYAPCGYQVQIPRVAPVSASSGGSAGGYAHGGWAGFVNAVGLR